MDLQNFINCSLDDSNYSKEGVLVKLSFRKIQLCHLKDAPIVTSSSISSSYGHSRRKTPNPQLHSLKSYAAHLETNSPL